MFYFSVKFQVQLQEETLEEDQAGPVNMRISGSQRPSIPTSARKSSCWARPRGGSHVIWSSSRFVQILWLCSCLTIKDLWSNLKWSRVAFFISPQSIAEWYPFTGAVFWRGGVSLTRLWRGGFPSLDRTANTRWKIVVISSFSRIWVWLLVPETAALFKKAKTSSETN